MTDQSNDSTEPIADADLVLRSRSGDAGAFGELWQRHYRAGLSVARSVTSSIDPDDLVQESYTRIYQAILRGGGPNGSFRAYLFTSIRNTAAGWGRSRRESNLDELDTVVDPATTDEAAEEALDRSLTSQAFRSLPSRWQEVLWYTEIEQMRPADVAPLLGMKAGAVSQLAFRAREGLREAWIQAHLRSAAAGSECAWAIEHLGAYSRGNLGTRDHKRLEQHIADCARCMIVAAEAKDVSQRLVLILLPLVLGTAGAAGYLATLQGGGAPIAALAAMPSAVVEGAVVAGEGAGSAVVAAGGSSHGGSAGSGGAGSGAGAAAGPGGGAGGAAGGGVAGGAGIGSATGVAAGAGASAGLLTGVGALVGVGSVALLVAGVVAAATILPGLTGESAVTSLPTAGDTDSSTITSDVGPDENLDLANPVVIEVDREHDDQVPPSDDLVIPLPPTSELVPPESGALPSPRPPAATPSPTPSGEPGDGDGSGDGDGTSKPGEGEGGSVSPPTEPEPEHTLEPTPVPEPGPTATAEPEPTPTATPDPEPTEPPAEPGSALPSGAPVISESTVSCVSADDALFDITVYTVHLSGEPGATVTARLGSTTHAITLGDDGTGTIQLRPSAAQLLVNSTVTFAYSLDGTTSTEHLSKRLSGLGKWYSCI